MKAHYHLIGIGGIGMGAIALILRAKGYKVSGSDLKESQMTVQLRDNGAKIYIGHDAGNVNGAQCIIYSSAVSADNPELKIARQKKIPIQKRAELLAELMKEHEGITVAGAHGKTTTTSMVSALLVSAGMEPTIAVGGIVNTLSTNAQVGSGKYFVAEVDESDGSFLYFSPHYSIITNMDREHLDYYKDWKSIQKAYGTFIKNTKPDGHIIACGEDAALIALLKSSKRRYQSYGFSKDFDLWAQNIAFNQFAGSFDCYRGNKILGRFNLAVPGRHNVANALAAITLGLNLSIDLKIMQQALAEFRGVQRRFQVIGNVNEVLVIDDYAHHPTEITATLKAAEAIKKKRLIAVFQPHRYSRVKSLASEFIKSLSGCDYLVLTDIYAASEKPIEGIDSQKLVQEIKRLTSKPVFYVKKEEIIDHLLKEVKPRDMVMMLGAGDITRIGREFVEALKTVNEPVGGKFK